MASDPFVLLRYSVYASSMVSDNISVTCSWQKFHGSCRTAAKTSVSVGSLQAVYLGSLPEAADVLNQMPCFMQESVGSRTTKVHCVCDVCCGEPSQPMEQRVYMVVKLPTPGRRWDKRMICTWSVRLIPCTCIAPFIWGSWHTLWSVNCLITSLWGKLSPVYS